MINKFQATIIEKQQISDLIYLIRFKLKRQVHFEPGQFLHLTLDEYEADKGFWPDSRVFSIASEPDKDELMIVFSIKGNYTKKMSKELLLGKKVWLKLPYGDFCINNLARAEQPVVLISGGTGISPFIPYLLQTLKQKSKRNIYHFHGIKNANSLFFKRELESVATGLENFHGNCFMDEITEASLTGWVQNLGKLNIDKILLLCPEQVKSEGMFFISGPPNMIMQFKQELLNVGINVDNIRTDQWE